MPAKVNNRGPATVLRQTRIINDSIRRGTRVSAGPSTASLRSLSSIRGMSMRSGQTSRHAPHSVDAKGRSFALGTPTIDGRHHSADGAWVYPAIGVSADLAVHRARVQARPTADAVERFPKLRVGQHLRAPVVQDDQVEFLWPVLFIAAARAGDEGDVAGDALTRRRARQ